MEFLTEAELTMVMHRIRMCMAEAGWVDGVDGELVAEAIGDSNRYRIFWTHGTRRVPLDVVWRARELTEIDDPICFKHYEQELASCLVSHRLVKDCADA